MNFGTLGIPATFGVGTLSAYDVWLARIAQAGGAVTERSKVLAYRFIESGQNYSFYGKIIYLLPLLGANIEAATVPLIDVLNRGPATNSGFTSSDFSETSGLSNPTEAAKYFDTGVKPSELGSSNNGGLGWFEKAIGLGSGVEPLGCYSTGGQRFVIDLRSTLQNFRWGTASNGAGNTSSGASAHYYGQRSASNSRAIYRDAAQVGSTNTMSDTASGASDATIFVMGVNASPKTYWKGRCACAYMTAGNLTTQEITDLHTFLNDFLITPTGR